MAKNQQGVTPSSAAAVPKTSEYSVPQVKRAVADAHFAFKTKVFAREQMHPDGSVTMVAQVSIVDRVVAPPEYERFIALCSDLSGSIPDGVVGRLVGSSADDARVEPGLFVVNCVGPTTGPVGRENDRVAMALLREALQVLLRANEVEVNAPYPAVVSQGIATFLFKAQRLGFTVAPAQKGE